jgi:hypothetical protein
MITCALRQSICPALRGRRGTPSTAGTCHTERNWNYQTPEMEQKSQYGAMQYVQQEAGFASD